MIGNRYANLDGTYLNHEYDRNYKGVNAALSIVTEGQILCTESIIQCVDHFFD